MIGQLQVADYVDTPEAIELCFPGWHVWRSRRGDELVSWCATRLDSSVGVSRTVICDTAEALRVALDYERKLVGRGPQARLVIARRVVIH